LAAYRSLPFGSQLPEQALGGNAERTPGTGVLPTSARRLGVLNLDETAPLA
jgi:hypothetical protein